MKADIRFQEILKKVNDQGRALIADLAESLKVSEMTVRRDIEHLSRLGMLRREKGFAIKGVSGSFEPAFAIRSEIAAKAKGDIAKCVANLVNDRETIILDGGSTGVAIAKQLVDQVFKRIKERMFGTFNGARVPASVVKGGSAPSQGIH